MKKQLSYVYFLAGFILMAGCSRDRTVYREFEKFPELSWNRFNIITFEFTVEEIHASYDLFFSVRHIPEIPYEELKVNVTLYTPSGDMRSVDQIFQFRDREGNRLSKCLGDLCDITWPLRTGFVFTETGTVKIEIENKFTKLEMPGLMEIGLEVIQKSQ